MSFCNVYKSQGKYKEKCICLLQCVPILIIYNDIYSLFMIEGIGFPFMRITFIICMCICIYVLTR